MEAQDITKQNRRKLLIKYLTPTILSYLSIFLFTIVDGIFVGQGVGVDALGAVNLVFPYVMFFIAFFHGELLASIFSKDAEVAAAGGDYLKAYGIDCMLTPVFFCFLGFYNGIGRTRFVMLQGVIAAFLVRVPISYFMSRQTPVSLFHIGLAVPCSSVLQIILCLGFMVYIRRTLIAEESPG